MARARNTVARSPLLRKGGAHEKSRSSQRTQQKQKVKSELEDWQQESANNNHRSNEIQ